ncbi:translation elongation factor Ts [Dongia sedimenti]|uniref:Elongation factor Ts n=1 Tax=Dongia sedimenti TaxID=3064282 RepID=A0ABU0YK39_9PROT|nr:translation elongation factor Ts [Rhodospirillaceae bacterium R-7]
MAEITAALVKELREVSGAGMMDCKKALSENGGNLEEAVDWLRKKGLAAAAKKAGRVAAEGLVAVVSGDKKGVLVEVNSETDFVARNDQFQGFVSSVAQQALGAGDIEALKNAKLPDGQTVAEKLTHLVATIGENMNLRRMATVAVKDGVVATYMHNATVPNMGKIGVLVGLESAGDKAKLAALGKQIAMHVAAANPSSLDIKSVSQAELDRERAVLSEQARASGKPEEIIAKMVEGRLRKYYEDVVLLEQLYVIDGESRVKQVVEKAAKEIGAPVTITGFARMALGEGIAKEQQDAA